MGYAERGTGTKGLEKVRERERENGDGKDQCNRHRQITVRNDIFPSNSISVVSYSFSPTFSLNIPLLYLVLLLCSSSEFPCLNSSIEFNRNRHQLVVSVSISEIERERKSTVRA
ncbi:hypothetical protein Nepgr_018630 [Nepenthes gracilis]|uniref:Uncharacterized protein n=1 Tax=Nepenthes gracilis TaxID=150966 RepID=A0AAD3STX3_NEPGR|nr:hypothetical protein Nepgr_018630 [Nepenthes gracilis]